MLRKFNRISLRNTEVFLKMLVSTQQQSNSQDLEILKCLSAEQKKVLDIVKSGRNVFITGSAGVGKSFLLNELIKSQTKKGVYVTASTGVAACNINGTTLHSFAGIGLGNKPASILAYDILKKPFKVEAKKRWLGCRILVIDEISMIDAGLFSTVEEVARIVRNNDSPFGGIQVILCGDFLQLPPVNVTKFAFETQAWRDVVHETVVLKKVFRQKLVGFVSLLNRLRIGYLTPLDIEVLQHCKDTAFPDDGIKATCLFPHKASCDKLNQAELSKLPGKMFTFEAVDWFKNSMAQEQLNKTSRYFKVLNLKVGAQVMLLNNLSVSTGLVNGARGVVTKFMSLKESKSPNETSLIEFENEECEYPRYPVVKFVNNLELLINPDQISTEVAGEVISYRKQLPLALAWAVSVHKAQGMTLERVELSIANAFEHGQAYVALSRVTSLNGLLLRNFDSAKVSAHPNVIEYYKQVDPLFESFADAGEEELKGFISNKTSLTQKVELIHGIQPDNYCIPSNISKLNNNVNDLKTYTEADSPTAFVLKMAEEKISHCRKTLSEIADTLRKGSLTGEKVTAEVSKVQALTNHEVEFFNSKAIASPEIFVKVNSIDDVEVPVLFSHKSSFKCSENFNIKKSSNEFNPIVIDSDDDLNDALFDDTNFDNDIINAPSISYTMCNSLSKTYLKNKSKDLLTAYPPVELQNKRTRKSENSSFCQTITALEQSNSDEFLTNIEYKNYTKNMLTLKKCQIKENYRNAVLKRLNSIDKFK
ncbi:ATP-dependent DNA helicase PIF1 isoform X2 [Hydra vulgaris]|uniref:ATP-dependent DNA helicase n=1 Tax=Hydra vulgaris TaxID=6087 RepID=A0ABM4BIE0_HYDVU